MESVCFHQHFLPLEQFLLSIGIFCSIVLSSMHFSIAWKTSSMSVRSLIFFSSLESWCENVFLTIYRRFESEPTAICTHTSTCRNANKIICLRNYVHSSWHVSFIRNCGIWLVRGNIYHRFVVLFRSTMVARSKNLTCFLLCHLTMCIWNCRTPFEMNTAARWAAVTIFQSCTNVFTAVTYFALICLFVELTIYTKTFTLDIKSFFTHVDLLVQCNKPQLSMINYCKEAVDLHERVHRWKFLYKISSIHFSFDICFHSTDACVELPLWHIS